MQIAHAKFLEKLLSKFKVQCSELVHVIASSGRVLSADVRARHTSPYHDMSAINGYAIKSKDALSMGVSLKVVGESRAGHSFSEELQHGQAIKVSAGSILPIGADTVVSKLEVEEKEGGVFLKNQVMSGQNICYMGVDFMLDEVVLRSGSVITPRDIGLAASMRVSWIPVRKRPHIAVFAIGDELVMIGDGHEDGKITSSSSLIISSLISGCGAHPLNMGIASDTENSINRLMTYAEGADLIVTTGGVSASADNLLRKTLDKGAEITQESVELNIPATVMFGEKNGIPVLALPGDPIAAEICATLFLLPLINKMMDIKEPSFKQNYAILDRDLDVNDKQVDYIFSQLIESEDKRLTVLPVSSYDRHSMSALAKADCIITVDANNCKRGDTVNIKRFVCSVVSA